MVSSSTMYLKMVKKAIQYIRFYAYYTIEGTSLHMRYEATSDQDTIINITNHSYFNLSGHKHNIYDHTLKIDADYYEHVDADGLATGEKEAVEGTPFDFRIPAKIGERVEVDHPQLKLGNGFDHHFFLLQIRTRLY